jgi:hypothetical protein
MHVSTSYEREVCICSITGATVKYTELKPVYEFALLAVMMGLFHACATCKKYKNNCKRCAIVAPMLDVIAHLIPAMHARSDM